MPNVHRHKTRIAMLPEFLPKDLMMLFSFINMKLRDDYDGSLDALCDDMGIDRDELEKTLGQAGFEYNPDAKKFW